MDNQQHTTPPTTHDRIDNETPKRAGDVLGLSDADPAVEIPQATTDRSPSHVSDEPATSRTPVLRQTKGATGIDMGAGGNGTDIEPPSTRRPDPTE
jgi:hypothetical protein